MDPRGGEGPADCACQTRLSHLQGRRGCIICSFNFTPAQQGCNPIQPQPRFDHGILALNLLICRNFVCMPSHNGSRHMSSSTPQGSRRPGRLVFPAVSQPEQSSHPPLSQTDASTLVADCPIAFGWNGPQLLSLQEASLDDTQAHAPVREDLQKYLALDPTVVQLAPSPPRGSITEYVSSEHAQNLGLSTGSTASSTSSSTTLTGGSSTLADSPIRVVPFHPSQAQKRRRVENGQAGIPHVRAKARITSSRSNVLQTEAVSCLTAPQFLPMQLLMARLGTENLSQD